ncbi:MAG: TerB N-terminal domain-containing protein [Ruminiclostridium sp.]|nr:TerB N-terminal domain-containing protein [Ruminiclostridium sp.]
MPDISELLEQIGENLRKSGNFDEKVYTDVPILRKGSDIPKPPPEKKEKSGFTELRELEYRMLEQFEPLEKRFYDQAKLMENYEDECEYEGDFSLFVLTYSDLSNKRLRGYFTWRKHYRAGEVTPAPEPFIQLYCYELINGVGAADPMDAHEKLLKVRKDYPEKEGLAKSMSVWLRDLVVVNGLPASLLDDDPEIQADKAMEVLMECTERTDSELYSALTLLSSYKLERSAFRKQRPEDFAEAMCAAYRALDAHYGRNGEETLFTRIFGHRVQCNYYMFRGALYYDRSESSAREYTVNGIRRYINRYGVWFLDTYHTNRSANKRLGELLRSAECIIRVKLGAKTKLGGSTATKAETAVIERALDELAQAKKRAEADRIVIDVSKLGSIRSAADITRDKLLVEEDEPVFEQEPAIAEPGEEPDTSESSELPLTAEELAYLRHLLYGAELPSGAVPTLLADAINEKLFDMFCDTVLDMNGGTPAVIEDYEQELKGAIPE